jgi:Sec-independent protein secretion pathway component TatC
MEDKKRVQGENNTLEDGCFELVKKIGAWFLVLVGIAYACLWLFTLGIHAWGISKYVLPEVMKQFGDRPGAIAFLLLSAFLMTLGSFFGYIPRYPDSTCNRENVEDIISKGVAKSIIAIALLVIAVLICYVLKDLDVMLTDVMLGISLIALFRKLLLTIINPMYLRNRVMNKEEGSRDAIESSLSETEDKIR